jgi:hypothetical protein
MVGTSTFSEALDDVYPAKNDAVGIGVGFVGHHGAGPVAAFIGTG